MSVSKDLGISADLVTGMAPFSVLFSATVSGLNPEVYTWDFGDGYLSKEIHPTHIYNNPGIFNVTLTIKDKNGIEYVDTENNFITVFLLAISVAEKPSGEVPLKVQFSYTDYIPQGYMLSSYVWDFGDGSDTSTEDSPVHVYSTAGRYRATITGTITKN